MSPLLFALYLNDIEGKLLECNCDYLDFGNECINCYLKVVVLVYADETVVVCDSEEGMRQALSPLCTYCSECRLKWNCSKNTIVVFSRGRTQLDNYFFECGGENIDVVEKFKYLYNIEL